MTACDAISTELNALQSDIAGLNNKFISRSERDDIYNRCSDLQRQINNLQFQLQTIPEIDEELIINKAVQRAEQIIINKIRSMIDASITRLEQKIDNLNARLESDSQAILKAITALQNVILTAIYALQNVIVNSINSFKDIILQLIKSLFGDSSSNDERILEAIKAEHQTTRKLIVDIIFAKLDAGFRNLETLISKVKGDVTQTLGITKQISSTTISTNGIVRIIQSMLAQIPNNIKTEHQITRQIIVDILLPKLESGFRNLETLIRRLNLTVDYNQITSIVKNEHQATRQSIVGILSPKLEAGFLNIETLIRRQKVTVDSSQIASIVRSEHQATRQICKTEHQSTRQSIVGILSPKLEAGFLNVESLIKKLKISSGTVDYNRISAIIKNEHQSTRQSIVGILSPKLEAGFRNVETLLKLILPTTATSRNDIAAINNKISAISTTIGTDEYPVKVPEWLTETNSKTINISNLTEFVSYSVKQLDAFCGQFPIEIEIEDTDLTKPGDQKKKISLPNLGETLAECMGILMTLRIESDANLSATIRGMIEAGSAKQSAIVAGDYARGNAEYLAYQGKQINKKIPMAFTPGKERLDEVLQETEIDIKTWDNVDKHDITDAFLPILELAAMWKAQNFEVFNAKNIKPELKDSLLSVAGFAAELLKKTTGKTTTEQFNEDWSQFLEQTEQGFITQPGISNTTQPYGKDATQRPRIRELGNTDNSQEKNP